jgi:transcriptional regulator with XRE-family HTH domain
MTLRRYREAKGWSQADVATRAQVSQGYIAQLEAGQKTPSLKVLRRLAKALKVPLIELVK